MRRFSRPRRRMDEEERILPLINIVFLLLIFFMVVGRLSASDPFEIVPPRSVSQGQSPTEDILISIGAEGQIAVNGKVLEKAAALAEVAASETTELRIKSDGRVEAQRIVALVEALRQRGVVSIQLMTVPVGIGG